METIGEKLAHFDINGKSECTRKSKVFRGTLQHWLSFCFLNDYFFIAQDSAFVRCGKCTLCYSSDSKSEDPPCPQTILSIHGVRMIFFTSPLLLYSVYIKSHQILILQSYDLFVATKKYRRSYKRAASSSSPGEDYNITHNTLLQTQMALFFLWSIVNHHIIIIYNILYLDDWKCIILIICIVLYRIAIGTCIILIFYIHLVLVV